MTNIQRHQAGAPASKGGEFKTHARTEDTVNLAGDDGIPGDKLVIIYENEVNRVSRALTASGAEIGNSREPSLAGLRAVVAADRAARSAEAAPKLTEFDESTLPTYPVGLGYEPTIEFGLGDENPAMYTSFNVDGVNILIWRDEDAPNGWANSISHGDEATGWDEDTDEEFITWANEVARRIEINAYSVLYSAIPVKLGTSIVDAALGRGQAK